MGDAESIFEWSINLGSEESLLREVRIITVTCRYLLYLWVRAIAQRGIYESLHQENSNLTYLY